MPNSLPFLALATRASSRQTTKSNWVSVSLDIEAMRYKRIPYPLTYHTESNPFKSCSALKLLNSTFPWCFLLSCTMWPWHFESVDEILQYDHLNDFIDKTEQNIIAEASFSLSITYDSFSIPARERI